MFGHPTDWLVPENLKETCFIPELPGHNFSAYKTPEEYLLFLRKWILEQKTDIVGMGYSLGGRLLLQLFCENPERFQRLCLFSSGGIFRPPPERSLWEEKILKNLTCFSAENFFLFWYSQKLFGSLTSKEIFSSLLNKRLLFFHKENYQRVFKDYSPLNFSPLEQKILHLPLSQREKIFYCYGEEDESYKALASFWQEMGSNILSFPNTGHAVLEENYEKHSFFFSLANLDSSIL